MSATATFCATCGTAVFTDPGPAAFTEPDPVGDTSAAAFDDATGYYDATGYDYQPAPSAVEQSAPSRSETIKSAMSSETARGIAVAAIVALLFILNGTSLADLPFRLAAIALYLGIFFVAMRVNGIHVTLSKLFLIQATASLAIFLAGFLVTPVVAALSGFTPFYWVPGLLLSFAIMVAAIMWWTDAELKSALLSVVLTVVATATLSYMLMHSFLGTRFGF